MLTPDQAKELRDLIALHSNYQFLIGRLDRRMDHAKRAKIQARADAAARALCAALTNVTKEVA